MSTAQAGDVGYGRHGTGYSALRRTDPRIADLIHRALGPARTVANIGAGAGSYEPSDRRVLAVEPSEAMIAQRPDSPSSVVVRAVAGALPLPDRAVDASMATVTIHQWPDPEAGLVEMRRVTRGPVVVLTFDPDTLDRLWLAEYAPELYRAEHRRYPAVDRVVAALGGSASVLEVAVPFDCTDGFTEAYFGRPEAFLEPSVRRAQSAWTFVDSDEEAASVERLRADLVSGRWDARYSHLRRQSDFVGALRLVVGDPA
jgi:SAM-dependent methyltransferase